MVKTEEFLPALSLLEDRSADGSPSVGLTLPGGRSDTIVLERFYAVEDDELNNNGTDHCHYTGRLTNDPEASVAVTGCPGGSEDVEFTILSQYLNSSIFQWSMDGGVKLIPDLGILDWFQETHSIGNKIGLSFGLKSD